jgi:hypothetical protein
MNILKTTRQCIDRSKCSQIYQVLRSKHEAFWDETFHITSTLQIDKKGTLEDCIVECIVRKESTNDEGYEQLGVVSVNLAELASADQVNCRYLLQDSKINSTIKVQYYTDHGNDSFM